MYAPVGTSQFISLSKQNVILSVGRFFQGYHCKKQLEMIRAFKKFSQNKIREWEFQLVGDLARNSIYDRTYLRRCQEEARGYPVYFDVNASAKALREL